MLAGRLLTVRRLSNFDHLLEALVVGRLELVRPDEQAHNEAVATSEVQGWVRRLSEKLAPNTVGSRTASCPRS